MIRANRFARIALRIARATKSKTKKNQKPSNSCFLFFLGFFGVLRFSLLFRCVFPLLSRDFRASAKKTLDSFRGFPCFFFQKARVGGSGTAQRESFRAGYPATSRVKNSGQALETLEKTKHLGANIHDPNARTSMTPGGCKKLCEKKKIRADLSFLINSRKKSDVHSCSARNSSYYYSRAIGCPNFTGAWHFLRSFCWKTPMPIKFLVL